MAKHSSSGTTATVAQTPNAVKANFAAVPAKKVKKEKKKKRARG